MKPDDRLKFFVQNFGGQYGGYGVSRTLDRTVKPEKQQPRRESQGLFDKLGNVFGTAAELGAQAVGATARYVGNTAVDIGESAVGVGKTVADLATQPFQLAASSRALNELDEKQSAIEDAYRAGNISLKDYNERINDLKNARYEVNEKYLDPISQGKTASERAEDVIDTTINVLTLGRWTPVKSAVTSGAKNTVLQKSLSKATDTLENTILRIPSAKELVARNTANIAKREAQRVAGETMEQYLVREGKRVAVGLLVKRPIFYQMNVDDATNVYQGMKDGEYGEAARSSGWLALQMIGGGPVGWFMRQGQEAGGKLKDLAWGRHSYIDEISKKIGNRNPSQMARFLTKLKEKAPGEYKSAERVFRIMQETNLQATDNRVREAVENTLRHYTDHGIGLNTLTPARLYRDMKNWAEADEIAQMALKSGRVKGISKEDAHRYAVVRWDVNAKNALAQAVEDAGDNFQAISESVYKLADMPGVGWGNNSILMARIEKILNEGPDAKTISEKIKQISTVSVQADGVPKGVRKMLAERGFVIGAPFLGRKTPIVNYEDTRRLVSAAMKDRTDIFDPAVSPQPTLNAVAGALDKAGMSPHGANQVANDALQQSLVANLSDVKLNRTLGLVGGDAEKGARAILSQLQRYVEAKKPLPVVGKISSGKSAVIDIRMLRPDEIREALGGLTKAEAKDIQRAILDAYTKVPLEFRGLGEKAVDYAFRYNPAQKYYARIQSALRYTYNPFFRFQEQVETAALSRMQADRFLWLQPKQQLEEGVKQLERAGFFRGNLMSAAADDVVFGRISQNMTRFQKRNLAGLANVLAERKGISLDDMINNYSDELDDALRIIVQYPRKGALASPLARTLNVAMFPLRYNTKVATMAAKKIAQLPPSAQIATIQGFMKMKDWMQSDEGIRWQSEHADAIQVLKWATPYGSIEHIYKVLTGGAESPAEFGLLGGLPFGAISQILDGQGIINLNTPYVDPRTGDMFPDYIPQTTRARAAVAVNDLINSMFTFPGRTLGLPGKRQTLREAVDIFIKTNGEDFDKQFDVDSLTPIQKAWIRVLKGDTSDEALDALYTSPAEGQFNYYTLPPMEMPRVDRVPGQVEVIEDEPQAPRGRQERVARPIRRP